MGENKSAPNSVADNVERLAAERRAALKKLGRFVAISAPAVTLMLAAGSKSAKAQGCSSNCGGSSRQIKTPEGTVDTAALLSSAQQMPLEIGAIRAVDFRTAFGLGDGKAIHPLDGIGVCLGAIQALTARIGSLEAAIG